MSSNQTVSLYAEVYGSLYFSAILSTAFYGVACIQTFFYYVHYEHDPLWTKIFVATLWALNTISEALAISGVYKFIMNGLNNPLSFIAGNPDLIFIYLSTAVIAIPTQGFLVYRLYVFSKKNIIVPITWVGTILVVLVCATIYVAKVLYETNGLKVFPINILNNNAAIRLATICFAVPAGVDVLIAMSMTFLLHRERTTVGFARTAHVLQRLMVFAVTTGTWTATFAVLTVVMMHVYQTSLVYAVFSIPISSVYCNTVLANLNARGYLRGDDIVHTDMFLTPSMRAAEAKTDAQLGQGNCCTNDKQPPRPCHPVLERSMV